MQKTLKKSAFLISIILFHYIALAQQTSFDTKIDDTYRMALELFSKEKYASAQKYFLEIANNPDNANSILKGNSEYYATCCAAELFNDDAEVLGARFVSQNPENPFVNDVYVKLGRYSYTKKHFTHAIIYFSKVNYGELSEDDRAECHFKTGYSWFMLDSLDKARKAFYEIKDIDTRYTPAATYYYSHIAYKQKNYETAIAGFNKLKDDETFSPLVPYYISQSYYFQEKYDELLAYAPALIDSVIETREAEMAKMIGDAYFYKSLYKEAIPYYDRFFDKGKDFKSEDYYQAGYCSYNQGNYEKAASMFEKATISSSLVSQNANYHLGDCYVHLKQKEKAILAFSAASKMDFDSKIKEDAFFNYAVLSFELSNSPFNSPVKALSEYISKYPESRRSDEAYHYLITSCLKTHNYQEALSYLAKIKTKDKNIKKAYQRAAFFRGLELFNNLQFDESLKMFELSLSFADMDALVAARTYYWTGENFYRLGKVNEALDNFNLFLASDESKNCSEFSLIYYNIAYCSFNKKDYNAASTWFTKYLDNQKLKKDKIMADAYNRLGDCYFADSKYNDALIFYTKAIEIGQFDKDYAIFQKAFTLGLLNDHKKKISLLNTLITSMPESGYTDDAYFEIGRSEVALQKPDDAVKYFNKLLTDYPSSSYVKKALLQLGLIDFNANRNDKAIEKYKKVIADYPATQEARSALTGLKNIYVEMNDVDSYLKYTETLGDFANVSLSEKDSLMYYAGENVYTSGDCMKAKENFKKYIDKFPAGNFILNAQYYYGDCSLKSGDAIEALKSFTFVAGKPRNNFTEPALASAARLNMDKNDFSNALVDYKMLDSVAEIEQNQIDARVGQMEANYKLNNFNEAIESAKKVFKTPGIAQENERRAHYIISKSMIATDQADLAIEHLRKLSIDVKNTEGAEAKFRIAEIFYNEGKKEKSGKEIFKFIELNSPHQYWNAKAFILLSKIYHDKGDDFQAANTLKSIVENYDNKDDGIIKEAMELKTSIEGQRQEEIQNKSQEDPEKDL